ncbi:hypothetical protein HMPREF1529_01965 [Microbacterium sp. oral taxon 186 str. F0373]|jgi:hypothetical protein|uniref:DUF4245 family protein n=1 Tax=Microbacterium sp. oral taxon 186 TaxID=712383 RepID=UPI0002587B5E|nr:DUF4245 family protein [Microbacterium sp. oral taxon 186]EIC07217.1 amino acid transporter [Microbacterium laevaniformans OR221]EPD85347.1 hypothetical protein HMPREF1529_01965 [Microbacterium sp. oral taxon 186 str. F0373]
MASAPRIVAELGRPETPAETADRKAAASRAYRQSKTFRNLVAALLVTMAVVAVVYFGVPRGSLPDPEEADVAAAAQSASASIGHPLLVPVVPENWRANSARLEGSMWRVVYAPPSGYVRVAQGVGVDAGWATKVLGGFAPSGTVTIDGITWDEYTIPSAARTDTVSYAISTTAGSDTVLIYGATDASTAAVAAAGVTDQILTMREEKR